jgi:putative transcriptional regulator
VVGAGQVPGAGVDDPQATHQGVVDAEQGWGPPVVRPGALRSDALPPGPFGHAVVEPLRQSPVGGPQGRRIQVPDQEGGTARVERRHQCLNLVTTGSPRGRGVDGVGEVDRPEVETGIGHQGVTVRQRMASHRDRLPGGDAHAGGVLGREKQAVGQPGGDHLGRGGRELLEGHEIGLLLVDEKAEGFGVDMAVVEIGGDDPEHVSAIVCQDGRMSLAGKFLVATPLITDPNFVHTVVYLYAHESEEGAAGVVLNRPTDEPTIDHLPDWRTALAPPPVVFWGGPVATESGLILLVEDEEIRLADDLYPPDSSGVKGRLYVGQAGWGPGQLEAEIAEGAWLVTDPAPAEVLAPFPDAVWGRILRRQGGTAAIWATHPIDPRVN